MRALSRGALNTVFARASLARPPLSLLLILPYYLYPLRILQMLLLLLPLLPLLPLSSLLL